MHVIQQALTITPDAALLFIALGSFAIAIEFLRPGLVMPAVCGSVLVFLGLRSLAEIPWSVPQLLLVSGGVLTIVLDIHFVYRTAALASFIAGLLLNPALHALPVLCESSAVFAIACLLIPLARRARRNKTEVAANVRSVPLS